MRFWSWKKQRKEKKPRCSGKLNIRPNFLVRRRTTPLNVQFVETIPLLPEMEKDTLYISMKYRILSQKCPCGCGRLIDVALSPTGRSLRYDGRYLTLTPSIGTRLPCRSHYSIIKNEVVWHEPMGYGLG